MGFKDYISRVSNTAINKIDNKLQVVFETIDVIEESVDKKLGEKLESPEVQNRLKAIEQKMESLEARAQKNGIANSVIGKQLDKESTKEYLRGTAEIAVGMAKYAISGNAYSYGVKHSGRKASEHFERAKELRKEGR